MNGSSTDSVRIENFFRATDTALGFTTSNDAIEKVTFADGSSLTAAQILAVAFNSAPQLNNRILTAQVDEDSSLTLNLLSNAFDEDGNSLTISEISLLDPSQGTLTLLDTQEVVFKPTADFHGEVQLNYTITDGIADAVGQVQISVTPINDAPVALLPIEDQIVDESQTVTYAIPSDAFVDIDGDSLSYSATLVDGSPLPSWLSFNDKSQIFTATPSFNDAGSVQVQVIVSDDNGAVAKQTFMIDINDVNRSPQLLTAIPPFETNEDASGVVLDVLAQVVDLDGDVLTIDINTVTVSSGSITLNADQTLTYVPVANFNGEVTLSYVVKDDRGGSLTVTNTIVVKPMNDAPVAGSASVNLVNGAEDTAYVIQTSDLLQGFSDVDGDSLSIINLSADNGSVVDNQDGTFTFTPDANYNSTVTLSYEVSDGQLGIAASQTLTLAPVNDAPEALVPVVDQTTDEGQVFSYQLPADAFIDVDSPNLSYSATLADGSALPSWLSFDANTLTFSGTPSFDDAAVLSVKVMASDGEFSAEQVFTLDVIDQNQVPVVDPNAPALTLDEDSSLVIDVLSRVVDFEGDALAMSNINVDAAQGLSLIHI